MRSEYMPQASEMESDRFVIRDNDENENEDILRRG